MQEVDWAMHHRRVNASREHSMMTPNGRVVRKTRELLADGGTPSQSRRCKGEGVRGQGIDNERTYDHRCCLRDLAYIVVLLHDLLNARLVG